MKTIGFILVGLLGSLLYSGLLTFLGSYGLFTLYGLFFYGLFFVRSDYSLPLAAGFAVGLELFGVRPFGHAILAMVLLYGLAQLFAEQLRFTSQYGRFIVALLIGLLVLSVILYPLAGYGSRLLAIGAALVIVSAICALLQRAVTPKAYELL